MRKLTFIVVLLISFLFSDIVFADNVNAATLNINANTFKSYVQPLRDDMKTIRTTMLSNMNYDSSIQDYFCLFNTYSGNPYGSCFVYSKTSGIVTSLDVGYSGGVAYFNFLIRNNNSTISYGKYNHSTSYTGNGFTINDNGYSTNGYSYGTTRTGSSGNQTFITSNSSQMTINNNNYNINNYSPLKWVWVDSSFDILFTSGLGHSVEFADLNVYESNFTNLINNYLPNEPLFDNNVNFISRVPELSFSSTVNNDSLGNVSSVDLRLNVDNYNSNYIYQFQKNGTSGTWTTMSLEYDSTLNNYYFTWHITSNSVYYFRVLNSSNNVVTTATFTVDNIISYENVSSVIDLGSNHYGYFSNYVLVQNVKSTTENNLVSILCERDRAFDNGFCSLFYSDLISNHSDINYFNDTTFAFHTLFGDANNILVSNKYYVFNFRVLKPFVPDISNVVLSTNYGDIDLANNFDKVYYNDGGSYTDYAIVFNTNNITLDSSYNLNSISVYFSVPLSNYYYNNIPDSFSFSIYRSFKLSYYDNIPDSNEISNLFSINNLSSIDGFNSQHLFFTDTTFNTYGFGGIISAPFRLLYALEDYDTCSDITIPFPHSNQTFTLNCVRSSIPSSINPLISILQIVLSGLICYRIAVSTLALIKQVLNPNDTNIEVVDL